MEERAEGPWNKTWEALEERVEELRRRTLRSSGGKAGGESRKVLEENTEDLEVKHVALWRGEGGRTL